MRLLRCPVAAGVALLATAAGAEAGVLLTFDELPPDTPANGASVSGVQFSFAGTNPGDASYNDSTFPVGPADAGHLSGSVLSGDSAGILTIDFAASFGNSLRFAVSLSTTGALNPGFTVSLFDTALAPLGTTGVATSPLVASGFSEGVFERTEGASLGRVVIDFADAPRRFALDNVQAAPEPGSIGRLVSGAATLAGYGGFRRRAAARRRP